MKERNEEDEEEKGRAEGKEMEKGRKGGGEKAAVRPVSDYIIAPQDLKRGLRRKKNKKTPQSSSFRHKSNYSDLKNPLQTCRITAGTLASTETSRFTTTGSPNPFRYNPETQNDDTESV